MVNLWLKTIKNQHMKIAKYAIEIATVYNLHLGFFADFISTFVNLLRDIRL